MWLIGLNLKSKTGSRPVLQAKALRLARSTCPSSPLQPPWRTVLMSLAFGATVATITGQPGLIVISVNAGEAAHLVGLMPGDVIFEIDSTNMNTQADLDAWQASDGSVNTFVYKQ